MLKEILTIMGLEVVQNAPLIFGIVMGYSLWNDHTLLAVIFMLGGSLLCAISMIPTEKEIFSEHQESEGAVLTNIVSFTALMILGVIYLHAPWSHWWMDLIGGFIAAAIMGIAQDLAIGDPIGVLRILVLGVSSVVSLLLIRLAVEDWPPLVSIIVLTTWFTVTMGSYKLWRRRHPLKRD